MIRPVLVLVLVVFVAALVPAQEPTFDVASVTVAEARGRGAVFAPPGEVRVGGAPLRLIVPEAFSLPSQLWELKIVPSRAVEALWRAPLFVIHGKGNPAGDTRTMLLSLLKERFGLRYHVETRQVPVYALTVRKPGALGAGWLHRHTTAASSSPAADGRALLIRRGSATRKCVGPPRRGRGCSAPGRSTT